jgi:hypothetical protein
MAAVVGNSWRPRGPPATPAVFRASFGSFSRKIQVNYYSELSIKIKFPRKKSE